MSSMRLKNQTDRIKDLVPTVSLKNTEGFTNHPLRMHGSHQLRLRDPSRLPAFSRHYFLGDPIKLIDWKAYARTDQLMIREDRKNACGHIIIGMDLATSMTWPNADDWSDFAGRKVPSKLEIALRIALNLAYLHIHWGDNVAIIISPEQDDVDPEKCLIIRNQKDVIDVFEAVKANGFARESLLTMLTPADRIADHCHAGYLLSDGLSLQYWHWLVNRAEYWRYLHVMSSLECDLQWLNEGICYYDETAKQRKEFLGAVLKRGNELPTRIAKWQERLKNGVSEVLGVYQQVTDETSIDAYQRDLFGE